MTIEELTSASTDEQELKKLGILYGGPPVPLIKPDCRSLGEVVLRKLADSGDQVLVIDSVTGRQLRAHQLRAQIIRLAHALQSAGLREGDVVALSSENRLEFPVILLAVVLLGATVAPVNTSYSPAELQHAFRLSQPATIFATKATLKRVLVAVENCAFVRRIILIDDEPVPQQSLPNNLAITLTTLGQFLRSAAAASDQFTPVAVNTATNVMLILCSSGTTGLPKGVQLTQANLHSAISDVCAGIDQMRALGLDDVGTLSVIPWYHAYGLMTLIGMTVGGSRLVTLARYSDAAFLHALAHYRCDVMFAVPPLLLMLAKNPAVADYDLSHLKIIFSGAAPLSRQVAEAVQQRLPSVMSIFQGFGMSEMTLSVLQQSPVYCTAGSVGVLRPGIWGKVVDAETGATLRLAGERGELCFRGAAIMKGYVGDERATSGTIDADGWLHTGDIGYYDENGEWFVVDRLKELIKYKGFQVPPAELEAVLVQHPLVADAAVIGVEDEACGERARAYVVRRGGGAGEQLSTVEVERFVADRVSPAKRLHGGVRWVAEIPRNATGKILRRELREVAKREEAAKAGGQRSKL